MLQQNILQSLLALTKKELKSLVDLREQLRPQMKIHYQQAIPGTSMGFCNYRLWHSYKVELNKIDKKISKLVRVLKELKREMGQQKDVTKWWNDWPPVCIAKDTFSFPNHSIYPNYMGKCEKISSPEVHINSK